MPVGKYRVVLRDTLPLSVLTLLGKKWTLRGISLLVLLVVWEMSGRVMFLVAPPSEVIVAFIEQTLIEQTLLWAVVSALRHAVIGYVIAVLVGVPLGFLLGFSTVARNVFDPIIDALYVTPMVALVPLIVLWFGIGIEPKIFLVFVFAVFIITINTEAGVTETPDGLVDAARVFGASDLQVYTQAHLRHSLPYILTGLRLGSGRAVRGMVVAELFISSAELGNYLVSAGGRFQIANLFAGIAFLSLLGYVVIKIFTAAEGSMLKYREAGT
jgi:NitT/TauT family transport system permease protein